MFSNKVCILVGHIAALIPLKAENETGVVDTLIPFLLPHEIFEALSAAGKYQVGYL
jgi:hypothetical protein